MKSFKFLGALALLTGAMLVATSCNKKDNEPSSGEFPTMTEIIGSWQFDEIPEGLDLLIPGLDVTIEQLIAYIGERAILFSTPTSELSFTYSYAPAEGKLTIKVRGEKLDIPVIIVLTKGPDADQMTASLPTGGSTTLTKICDGNFFAGDCQGDDPQPEDDEKTGTIPSAEEMAGTWHFDIVPEHFAFDFLDGVAAEDLYLWLSKEEEDNISTVGSMEINNSNGQYEYDEETGKLSIDWVIANREADFLFEGTVIYVRADYICLTVELVEGELAQNIYLSKECNGNMFEGECSDPVSADYPEDLLGSWQVISELPKELGDLKDQLNGNPAILYFDAEGVAEVGYEGRKLLDGTYNYNANNGNLEANYTMMGVPVFSFSDAVATNLAENQIKVEWDYDGNPIELILEWKSENNLLVH